MTTPVTAVLELRHVSKAFRVPGTRERRLAVDDVNLTVSVGEIVALVGESGSGKSTVAKIALRLIRPDAGEVSLLGLPLSKLGGQQLRATRQRCQPIFQDPVASFNPRRRVGGALAQALLACGFPRGDVRSRSIALLEQVGLRPGASYLERWPHELSGGQRQRLAIARALALDPKLIIADEPLTGADVSIRGQILNLLLDLQTRRNVGYLFITHDISLAQSFASRIAVMRRGQIVEQGETAEVLETPNHEYTKRLLAAVLRV
jgi:ABC-type oligopeptide transport system ATPase subunit